MSRERRSKRCCSITEGRNATLKWVQTGPDGVVIRKRAKLEYRPKHVEEMAKEISSKKCVDMDDAKILQAWKEGIELACVEMATVGIVPKSQDPFNGIPDDEFNAPWLSEKVDLPMMRRAEATGDGEWVDVASGVGAFEDAMGE